VSNNLDKKFSCDRFVLSFVELADMRVGGKATGVTRTCRHVDNSASLTLP